ncbi:MAG: hypothetical protein QG582_116, partial [Candidatus Thermoplasmatota archaeon]|nr:hypothetical protein [Candidatus Thermoplasmatota archaeon]
MPRSIIDGALGSKAPAGNVTEGQVPAERSAEDIEIERIA